MDYQSQLQKLEEVKQFITEDEYLRRKAQLAQAFGVTALDQTIVCFYCDGSDKYTHMTRYSLLTFLQHTPRVTVGVLTHSIETRERLLRGIPEQHYGRILWRIIPFNPYFKNWNPTQCKLSIQQFVQDGFKTLFWFDSDTITIQDLTAFLSTFANSTASFYFVPDHVMQDPSFREHWEKERPMALVPQACVMGFKSDVIVDFFQVWQQTWQEWIEPHVFANYPDPRPNFPGSAFCAEQYALGMALTRFFNLKPQYTQERSVLLFERTLLEVLTAGNPNIINTNVNNTTNTTNQQITTDAARISARPLFPSDATTTAMMSMSALSLTSVPLSGYNVSGGYNMTSMSGVSFSGAELWFNSLDRISLNLTSFGAFVSQVPTSGLRASRQINVSSLFSAPAFTTDGTGGYVRTGMPIIVDQFGGGLLHCYNHNYDALYNWSQEVQKF